MLSIGFWIVGSRCILGYSGSRSHLVSWSLLGLVCCMLRGLFFFFKQKTAYEMRISDWSSDVCSSDLEEAEGGARDPIRVHVEAMPAQEARACPKCDQQRPPVGHGGPLGFIRARPRRSDAAGLDSFRRQPFVCIVGAQTKPVLGPRREQARKSVQKGKSV